MQSELQEGFFVGDWMVSPAEGILSRQGQTVHLEPKVMEVLVYLAAHQGKVVTREELERDVWHGALVGYDAVTRTVIKLRKALQDDAKKPRYIITVPKKGYQLVAAIQDGEVNQAQTSSLQAVTRKVSLKVVVGIILLGVSVITWWVVSHQPALQQNSHRQVNQLQNKQDKEHRPSIVVLPFKNLGNEANQEYFSDGITDDLITDLSKVGSLHVVARQSAYHYKSSELPVNQIAKDLGVQYVVEGSVQKSGGQLRINVQLSDANKGRQIWAERFDAGVEKIFAIQDEITRRVINAMYVTLSSEEDQRVAYRSTNSFDAYDVLLLGLQASRNRAKEGYDAAHDYFRRAINIDPGFARAYGALAVVLTNGYRHRWTNLSFEEARIRSLKLAQKAVELDKSTPQIYWSLGFVHLFRKEYKEAEAATKRSIELSPNYADGYGLLAFIANWRGKAKDAEIYIKKAIKLNPYHTFDYPWNLGLSYYTQGKYKEAIVALQQALERNETVLFPRLFLAASYVRLGQLDEARWEVEQAVIQRPATTISHLSITMPFEKEENKQAFLNDIRQAGLPE